MITTFLITIISILIGYTLGRITPEQIKEKYEEYKREIIKKREPVGAVIAPDAKRLELINNPEKAEEEEELNKLFGELLK